VTSTGELSGTAEAPVAATTPTAEIVPAGLPRTGAADTASAWLMLALTLVLSGALALVYRRFGQR
jgi:LPXTG-motif cell wall-anchored protein